MKGLENLGGFRLKIVEVVGHKSPNHTAHVLGLFHKAEIFTISECTKKEYSHVRGSLFPTSQPDLKKKSQSWKLEFIIRAYDYSFAGCIRSALLQRFG